MKFKSRICSERFRAHIKLIYLHFLSGRDPPQRLEIAVVFRPAYLLPRSALARPKSRGKTYEDVCKRNNISTSPRAHAEKNSCNVVICGARPYLLSHSVWSQWGPSILSPSAPPMHKFLPERERRKKKSAQIFTVAWLHFSSSPFLFIYFCSFAKCVRHNGEERMTMSAKLLNITKNLSKILFLPVSERAGVFHRVIARRRRALSESG
jgi:hypothetical protein